MSIWLKIYYKILTLMLNILVKTKPIPNNPIQELGLDTSSIIIYILPYNSKLDLLTLRMQCIKHNFVDPLDPLTIGNIKLPRYSFISSKYCKHNCNKRKDELIKIFHKYSNLYVTNPSLEFKIVPVYIMFGRRPYQSKRILSLSLCFFSKIKKILSLIWLGRNSLVCFFPYVSLSWIVTRYRTDKIITQKLVRIARINFVRQHSIIVGPRLPIRQDLFNQILFSKPTIHVIKDEARTKNLSYKEAQKNAIKLMREIAANFSHEMVRLTDWILSIIWNYLYQEINVNNVERVRHYAYNGHEIVYIPCHRSHMDYLLISYVLYHQGLALPHIAAGINLNFWPIGIIFRYLGAFFIRRTFKSNKLYSTVFREYLSALFNRGHSIEYFIEGSRSRTGYLLNPKTGTLSMTIQAMLRGSTRPIALVPIYIGYEHVIEIDSYAKELHGTIKKRENFLQMLRGLSRLRNLGQSYVNFGEPLSLIKYLNYNEPNWHKSINLIKFLKPSWLNRIVNNIANDLMIRINNAGAVNAINLCYTVLLTSPYRLITRKQLVKQLDCYLNLMRNVPYSIDSTVPSTSSDALIDHALKMNKLRIKKDAIGNIIAVPHDQAILMTYYSNNITHMLVLPSILAAILNQRRCISYQEIIYCIDTLYPILKAELFLHWNYDELSTELDKLINEFIRQELVVFNINGLIYNPSHSFQLHTLALITCDILQRYAITFWLIISNPFVERVKLKKEIFTLIQQLSKLNIIHSSFLFDKDTFNKILLVLYSEGYVNNNDDCNLKKSIKIYQMLAKMINPQVVFQIENINR